jgi:hypothetical protein
MTSTSSAASSPSSSVSASPSDRAASLASDSTRDPQGERGSSFPCITSEMIQRATEVLWASGRLEADADGVDQMLVYRMLRAALHFEAKD